MERNTLQFHWRLRAGLNADKWDLPMAVVVDGEIVGSQGLHGEHFLKLRTFETGSWLGQAYQGRGIGKEMRAAILHLGFEGFGAQRAESGARHDNHSSIGVSRSLGYEDNGDKLMAVGDEVQRELHFVLPREVWEQRRRHDIVIEGLGPVRAFLGLEPEDGSPPPAPPR